MKKVLVGFIMDGNGGGVDRYLLNFLEVVNDVDVQLDFLTNKVDEDLKKRLEDYGSKLYEISNLHHPVKQYRQVCRLIEKNQYDTVYLNISTAIDCVAAFAAKKCKVKKRVLHCHASGNDCSKVVKRIIFNTIHKLCRLFLYRAGTDFYGASRLAGEWAFPRKIVSSKKFQVVVSGIDTKKYAYNNDIRRQIRSELNLHGKLVIGHAGSFTYVKNHLFLLEIFREIWRRNPSAALLLSGTGQEFEKVQKKVKEYGIESAVHMLGWRDDLDRLLQAMDIFVLPSHFEGLSIVSLEAQASGLCCVLSDAVPKEAKISEKCYFLPLSSKAEVWAEFILAQQIEGRENVILDTEGDLFDINMQISVLNHIL